MIRVCVLLGAVLAGGAGATTDPGATPRLHAGPTRPALVLPVYNERGVEAVLGALREFIDTRTTILVVSGNEQPPFEPAFVAQAVERLHAAVPEVRLLVATSGAHHVAEAVESLPSAARGVVYVYEPNEPNVDFTWDFDGALDALAVARAHAEAAGVRLSAKPTGRPLLEAGLRRHAWDYGRLGATVLELFVQTQTFCRQGPPTYAAALGVLAEQTAGARGVYVQVSVGPTFPNGVHPERAVACLAVARPYLADGTFTGVLVWWSPEALDDARDVLRALRPRP